MKCPLPITGRRRGFTLVELLVVLAVISIVSTLAIMAFRGVNSALNLSSATQMVSAELTNARQTALTLDETVQVRFYQFPDVTGATTTKEFQAMQMFQTRDNVKFTPLDKITYLPSNIMISSSGTYSPPLSSSNVTATTPAATDPAINLNGVGQNYTYVPLAFKSNGTIDTTAFTGTWFSGTWFITMFEKRYASATQLVNYTTVSIDPQDGRLRIFQP
jgi:uncharacterized protein (TIGR02596 family)